MIQELNVNNFDQEINKDKPVVVEFYTNACSHCKKLAGRKRRRCILRKMQH